MSTRSFLPVDHRVVMGAIVGLVFLACGAAQADDCKRPKGLEPGTPHVIKFETGSAKIPPDEQTWLKDTAKRLADNPALEVCVIGQADKTGDPAYNRALSLKRAEAVASMLKDHGLADKTFQVIGRGEAFGDTSDSLLGDLLGGSSKLDRRVEVIFYR